MAEWHSAEIANNARLCADRERAVERWQLIVENARINRGGRLRFAA